MKPVATVGSMHVCPMCSGTVPHVGGPVVMGDSTVLMNGKPVAVMGDMCTCAAGPPDVIVTGNPSILVNGKPIACVGDMTAHGGAIVQGEPNILVGTATPVKRAIMPVNKIPFPEIRVRDRIGAAISGNGSNLNEARENQEQLRNEAEDETGDPIIYNLQWCKEEKIIRGSKVIKKVILKASVINAFDGQSVSFGIKRITDDSNKDDVKTEDVISLTGTVKDKEVQVEWEVEDYNEEIKD